MGLRRFVFPTLSLFSLWVILSCDSTSPPEPPVAEVGPDQPNANVGELVTLNGSGSYDTKNKTLTFSWTFLSQPAGSTATLSGATTSVASFTPDVGGTYVVQLTVNNGKLTAADQCTITVNGRPVAVAGQDEDVKVGTSVQLDGTGSHDPDGDPLTYLWTLQSQPSGSQAFFSSATSQRPTFTADVGGDYEIRLVVNDGSLDSDPDECVVSANTPPVAEAGPDQTVLVDRFFQLDGSGSSDPDGDALSFSWSIDSKPTFSVSTLSNPKTVNPGFTPDPEGDYVISLIVSDGKASSDPDYVAITAVEAPPPHADAGPDQFISELQTVQLNGGGSWDEFGLPLTYDWSFLDRPDGSSATLSNPSTAKPTFVADVDGIYRVWLVVSNGYKTSSDEVRITVIPEIAAGQYEGTTSQDRPITFVVSSDQQGEFIQGGLEITFRAAGSSCAYWGWVWTVNSAVAINEGHFEYHGSYGSIEGSAVSSTEFLGSSQSWWLEMGCDTIAVDWGATRTGPVPVPGLVESAETRAESLTPIRREQGSPIKKER